MRPYLHLNLKLDGNSIAIDGPIVNPEEIFVLYRLLVIFTRPPPHDQNNRYSNQPRLPHTNRFQEARRYLKPGASITRKSTPCIPGKHYYSDNSMQRSDQEKLDGLRGESGSRDLYLPTQSRRSCSVFSHLRTKRPGSTSSVWQRDCTTRRVPTCAPSPPPRAARSGVSPSPRPPSPSPSSCQRQPMDAMRDDLGESELGGGVGPPLISGGVFGLCLGEQSRCGPAASRSMWKEGVSNLDTEAYVSTLGKSSQELLALLVGRVVKVIKRFFYEKIKHWFYTKIWSLEFF